MNLVLILTVKKNRKKFKVNVDFRNEFFLKHYHMIMFIRIIIYYHFLLLNFQSYQCSQNP